MPHDFRPDSTGVRKAGGGSAATDGAVAVMGCKSLGRSSVFDQPDVGDGEVTRSDASVVEHR